MTLFLLSGDGHLRTEATVPEALQLVHLGQRGLIGSMHQLTQLLFIFSVTNNGMFFEGALIVHLAMKIN